MAITLNKPYAGLRIAASSGDLVFTLREGFCDGIVLNTPYIGLRASVSGGDLVFLVSDQKVRPDGTLFLNKPYIGRIASLTSGDLVFIVDGKKCTGNLVTSCGCEICCTLAATVQVADSGDMYAWTDPLDVMLLCGGQLQTSGGYACLNDIDLETQIYVNITTTYTEKNTLGSPEAYSAGGASGTREVKTDIWTSEDFDIEGETYRISYWRCEGTIYQTLPTVSTTTFCDIGWVLQHQATDDNFGNFWETIAGYDLIDWLDLGATSKLWMFNWTDDNPYDPEDCPDGYSYNAGELNPSTGCNVRSAPYVGGSSDDEDTCPVALVHESWYRLIADPDTDPYRIKCAKVTIADLCDDEPDLQAMFDDSLNPETLFSPELEYSGWFN